MNTKDGDALRLALTLVDRERLRFSVLSETFFVLTLLQDELRRALGATGRGCSR